MVYPKKKAIICPRCNKLISSDESLCPYCGLSHPGSRWHFVAIARRYFNQAQFIPTIITINLVMFFLSLVVSPLGVDISLNPFTLLAPSNQALFLLGATGAIPFNTYNRWWTLISASYLHSGILHIFFNMMVLYQIAPMVLEEYGANRTITIYTLGGALGFYLSCLAGVPYTIGASASLFALVGALLYYGRSRGGLYGQILFKQVGIWVLGLFLFGLLFPNINNWAHGGGLAGGILLGYLLGYREKKGETYFEKIIATISLTLTMIILLWAVGSTFFIRLSH